MLIVDCLKFYVESMKSSFCDVDSFFSESELQQISDDALDKSVSKVRFLKTIARFVYFWLVLS